MYWVHVKCKTLSKREMKRIVGNKSEQLTGVRRGRKREVGDGAEERRCEILCIFNMSTARQSIQSEGLGTGGKTWTRKRGRKGGAGGSQ